jgi:hypothetical protein
MARKTWSLGIALLIVSVLLASCRSSETTPTFEEPLDEISLLFVHNATSGTLTPVAGTEDTFLLTLEGVSYSTLWFTERPAIAAGHIPTQLLIDNWDIGENSFTDAPPNAALDILEGESEGDVLVVQLFQPKYDQTEARLNYKAKVLRDVTGGLESFNLRNDALEEIPGTFNHASLFIDCRNFVVFNDRLYIGTWQNVIANQDMSSPEVWEINPQNID